MSDTTNTATIKAVVDASGVEVGLRKIDDAAGKTKRTLDNLGSSNGVNSLGDGAAASANKFAYGTKGIIEAIEKSTRALELGKRGTVDYYATLGNQKGINPAVLKPYLDQLDAVTRKTALAAEAQRKLDDGQKFIDGLRGQASAIGKSASQLAEMQAAQLGVSESAQPLIDKLREAEEASAGFGGSLGITGTALAAFAAAAAGALSIGAFTAGISAAIGGLAELDDMAQKTGSSVEVLSRLQKVAQVTGQDFGQVDAAIVKLARGMGGLDEDSNKVISALKRLGISTKDIATQDPSKVFLEAAKNLQNYADGAGKAQLANDLIKGSGADLLPFFNDIAENIDKFSGAAKESATNASAFGDNLGLVRLRLGEVVTTVAVALLPTLVKLSQYIKDLVDSGKFKQWADAAGGAIGKFADAAVALVSVLEPAAKIATAYFAIFVAAPALVTGAATALAFLHSSALLVTASLASGATAAGIFNTALFGTAVAANTAAGGLFTLKTAASTLFAAFAGWQIGTYLREQFAEVRVAGLYMVEALLVGWESVKFGALGAWEAVKIAWDSTLGNMKVAFASYVQSVADGLSQIGASDTSAQVSAYAEGLRAAGNAQLDVAAKTIAGAKAMVKAHQETLAGIRSNIQELVTYELTAGRVVQAVKNLPKVPPKPDVPAAGKPGKPAAEKDDLYGKGILAATAERDSLLAAAVAQREYNEEIGLSKAAVVALKRERLDGVASLKDESAAMLEMLSPGSAVAAMYREQAQAIRDRGRLNQEGFEKQTDFDTGKKALEDLDKYLDPARATDFGDALSDAFGRAGSTLGKLASQFDTFSKRQVANDKARADAKTALNKGDLNEVTYAKRVGEINAKNAAEQLGGYGQMTSAAAGFFNEQSKGYKALQTASQVFHAAELALTLAEHVPKAINAVLTQGEGDPYTAFARMATMAAVVAGLGVAVGGTGGGKPAPTTFKERQESQGTGTVLGDASEKSSSLANSLAILEQNSSLELNYQGSMLQALKSIESALGGAAKGIFQTAGLTSGSGFGSVDSSSKSFFGSNKSTTITDSGVRFSGSLGALRAGGGAGTQYEDVTKTSDGGLFHGNSTSLKTNTAALADAAIRPFTLIFDKFGEAIVGSGAKLGVESEGLTRAINAVGIDFAVSTRGLKGQELVDALSAGMSVAFDKVTVAVFPQIAEFQDVGEGLGETLVRIATDFTAINTVFESFGKSFGLIGLESIAARERLIELSGGLEKFTEQGQYFLENFFSEKEQRAALQKRIAPTLEKFGLSTETEGATKAFRDVVVALDTTTKSGAEAYTTLMSIAPAFADIVKGAQAIFDERDSQRKSLRDQLDEAILSPAQLKAKQRSQVDPSNLDLFDQVETASANRVLQDQIDAMVKSSRGLAEVRAMEIAGMDASTVVLYDRVAALKGVATAVAEATARESAIASANAGFQSQIDNILKTRMTADELREFETKGLDKSTVALYDRLAGLKAEQEAAQAAAAAAASAASAQKQAAEESARAAEALRDAWKSATDSILDEVARIRGLVQGGGKTSLASAQAEFTITTAQARAGDIDAAKLLPKLSQTLLELAEANAATSLDLARFRAQTLASLVGTGEGISSKFGLKLPGFAVGTNFLPSDMPIIAHEGERIVPAADNRALMAAINRPAQDKAGAARDQRAAADMEGLRAEVRSIALSSDKTARLLDRVIEGDFIKIQEAV